MRNWIVGVVLGLVLMLALLALFGYMAGAAGVVLGIFVLASAGLLFARSRGVLPLPNPLPAIFGWAIGIFLMCITMIFAANAIVHQMRHWGDGEQGAASITSPVRSSPRSLTQTLQVSEKNVDIPIPQNSIVAFYPERGKSVLIRFLNGDEYEIAVAADGKITITRDGKIVPDFGYDNPFGSISLRAKNGGTVSVTAAVSPK